jgi:hypothetical protein
LGYEKYPNKKKADAEAKAQKKESDAQQQANKPQ